MTGWLLERRNSLLVAFAVSLVFGALLPYVALFRGAPARYFDSDEDHFLFGSIGAEVNEGVPYWIWLVLPRIFPEHLPGPGGYASIGVLTKDGSEMPIGFSKVTIGFPRVGINCAMCHTTSVRTSPDGPRTLVAGGPSNQTSPQQYLRFLLDCASDPRFTADVILGEIARNHQLSIFERVLYRFVVVPQTRQALLRLKASVEWMDRYPEWGRGRSDLFNMVKFRYLRQPVEETIGTSDMPPLWNLAQDKERAYHWDGLNPNLQEVVLSSAVGVGTAASWIDRDVSSLRRIQNYISQLQPPKYPLAVDATLAAAGAAVYKAQCADCHDRGARRTSTVIPVAEIGTDRARLDMWTPAAVAAYNAFGEGHDWKFSSFRTTTGYVSAPLDGIWLRAPYLHNGSVPSLADLLNPVNERPRQFWRGFDLYDTVKVGFVAAGAEAQAVGTSHDTGRPGNGNAGHLYGTTLSPESKRALLEYLKTM